MQHGNDDLAIHKIDEALQRTDGCVQRGGPDGAGEGRDWITGCTEQTTVHDLLQDARDALLA